MQTCNMVKALRYLRKAAAKGHPKALYHLANLYMDNIIAGMRKDGKEPLRITSLTSNGIRSKLDIEEAKILYRLAAEQGHEEAEKSFETLIKNETKGIYDDIEETQLSDGEMDLEVKFLNNEQL
jgi:TPR repeat protein